MIAQYTAAGIVAENRRLASPGLVDSVPTSGMQEDHVSMGWAADPQAAHRAGQPVQPARGRTARRVRGLQLRAPLDPSLAGRIAVAARRAPAGRPAGPDIFLAPVIEACAPRLRPELLAASNGIGTLA